VTISSARRHVTSVGRPCWCGTGGEASRSICLLRQSLSARPPGTPKYNASQWRTQNNNSISFSHMAPPSSSNSASSSSSSSLAAAAAAASLAQCPCVSTTYYSTRRHLALLLHHSVISCALLLRGPMIVTEQSP